MTTLDLTLPIFPVNAVNIIAQKFATFDNLTVMKRPLRLSDPNLSIGVYAMNWLPTPGTMEMMGVHSAHSSTLEQYVINVEAFVKDTDEEQGLASHSVLAELVRTTLGSDIGLRASLGGLQATFGSTVKQLMRFWVRSGRYANNQIRGANLYLTTCELMVEVQKISG